MCLSNLLKHLVRDWGHLDKDRRGGRDRREVANTVRKKFSMRCCGRRLPLPRFLADPVKMLLLFL